MTRPLLITDCDEVLLHMVAHFGAWLDEAHALDFAFETGQFSGAMRNRATGAAVPDDEIWPLLDGFFHDQMHRQTLVPHAGAALKRIDAVADIVVLTNLRDEVREGRVAQLAALGIHHRVVTNQGGKGRPVRMLVDEIQPSVTVFVDDLPQHHDSVNKAAPEVWRLHMVAEPRMAHAIPPAPFAHARIDDWQEALPWILERMARAEPATPVEA
jgi:hypothetical protein